MPAKSDTGGTVTHSAFEGIGYLDTTGWRFWACGFSLFKSPPLQPASSIMPGKVNPVMPELLDMVAFQVVGCDTVARSPFRLGSWS